MTGTHVGVDIGGTKTDAVVTDSAGKVLHRHRMPTERGAREVVAVAKAAVAAVCEAAGIQPASADSVGIGIPGTVADGVVTHALNLGIERLDLGAELSAHWGCDVVVDNDVNAAAVGAWMLAGDGSQSIAYLNLGTGLAAGVVLDGKLWRGARGAAGEIGHVSVDPAGPLDADGMHGGLETYASGSGIARQAAGAAPVAEVIERAPQDARFAEIVSGLHFGLATAVRMLILTFDVDEVVVGGGLAGIGDSLLDGARGHFAAWEAKSAFIASVDLPGRVRLLDGTEPVAAIGAAMRGAGRG